MPPFTPQLQLETLFELNTDGRIVSTGGPNPTSGPAFCMIRDGNSCAWAVHVDVSAGLANELNTLARLEPPNGDFTSPPRHATAYDALVGGRIESGPVFTFPSLSETDDDAVTITDISQLERHLHGWTADELPGCSPIIGILQDGHAVSVCFCARRTLVAAEAGLNTAGSFRRRGFGARVAAAWARAIRDSGRLPLYSTSWSNTASLAVAHKLGLNACGSDWNLYR